MLAGHLGSLNVRGLFWKPFNYHHTQALVSSSRDSHPDGLRRQVTGKRSVEVEEVGRSPLFIRMSDNLPSVAISNLSSSTSRLLCCLLETWDARGHLERMLLTWTPGSWPGGWG